MKRTDSLCMLLMLTFFSAACTIGGFEKSYTTPANKLDSALSIYAEREDITGFGIGVIFHDQVVFSKTYGQRNVRTGEPLTTRSLFHMASLSKPVVATAVMQLVEAGKITLEDRIIQVLPYFRLTDIRYSEITIGQMLSHLSGMPDEDDFEWNNPVYDEQALQTYVRSLKNEILVGDPGSGYHYSNMAFDILAALVAEVSGTSFEEYVEKNIFNPAGMEYSTFLKKKVPDSLFTSPHVYDFTSYSMDVSPVYPYNRRHAGSSTLHSNVEDMIRWAFVNLHRGLSGNRRILQDSTYDLLWEKKFQIGRDRYIGLSWFISEYEDKTMISHSGADTGFRSAVILLPEDTTAVIAMGNSDNFQSYGIVRMVLDLLYDQPPMTPERSASYIFLSDWGKYGLDSAYNHISLLRDEKDPDTGIDDGTLIDLALPLFQQGRTGQALQLVDMNRRLFPESIWNYQFKAEILYKMNKKEEAIFTLRQALQLAPDDTYTLNLLKQYRSE